MVDSINGIFDRMEAIQDKMKSVGAFKKPEKILEFERMLKERMASSGVGQDDQNVSKAYHPFLQDNKESSLETTPLSSVKTNTPIQPDSSAYMSRQQMIQDAVTKASGKYGVSPDLIKAVIKVESAFDPNAVSHAGAQGLMQLMPKTAEMLGVENSFDIYQNVEGGTKYLRQLLDTYQGDLDKALSAYNAGPHRVAQYNGVPDIEETQNYVLKVKNYYFK